jgi:hypothetical protein
MKKGDLQRFLRYLTTITHRSIFVPVTTASTHPTTKPI